MMMMTRRSRVSPVSSNFDLSLLQEMKMDREGVKPASGPQVPASSVQNSSWVASLANPHRWVIIYNCHIKTICMRPKHEVMPFVISSSMS